MDFLDRFTAQLNDVLGVSLVNILIALVVLIVGWLIALLISWLIRGLLHRTEIDDRVAGWVTGGERPAEEIPVENWISTAIFWLLMLVVLIIFFQVLGLAVVTGTLNNIL